MKAKEWLESSKTAAGRINYVKDPRAKIRRGSRNVHGDTALHQVAASRAFPVKPATGQADFFRPFPSRRTKSLRPLAQ